MFDRREPTNTQKFRRSRGKRIGFSSPTNRQSPITCHICGNTWDCSRGCFVCGKCHTVFDPFQGGVGLGGELKVARARLGVTQIELAKIIGCSAMTIGAIESGKLETINPKGKLIRERLRIWIENSKSPIDKRKEIEDMFNHQEKENQ